jgi:hypothetical protein
MSDYYTSKEEFQVQRIDESGRFCEVPLASISPVDVEVIRERAQAATLLGSDDMDLDHTKCGIYQSRITWQKQNGQPVQCSDLNKGDAILFVTQDRIYEAIVGERPQETTLQ